MDADQIILTCVTPLFSNSVCPCGHYGGLIWPADNVKRVQRFFQSIRQALICLNLIGEQSIAANRGSSSAWSMVAIGGQG